mgnify:FL=1
MGIRVPRITVNADFGDDTAFGDLSLLSVGYGLHQAWVYAVMFGTPTIFGTQTYVTGMYGSHASLPFLVSIVVFGLCLLFAGITDQRLLRTYISKKTLAAGAALMSAGTLLLLATPVISGPALEAVSGVMTGIGSAILILFWGVAFARCDSASIVLNSSIAISIAIGVYAIGLHYGPFPIAGILAGIIPLLELAILWNKTPAPYSERNEVPIFKPLPVNHAKFFLRFGIPVFVFGVALGTLRQTSIQYIVPASNVGDQIAMLLAAGFASVVILVTIVALGGGDKWSRYFRPLVPFIAVTLFFLPLSEMSDNTFATMFLVMGYLCFEALMWIFFGELAQRFRLSPIYVFGLGRGRLALAGLAALTSLGALLFLAWSLRDIRATPDAIPAWPLGGVIGCVVLTFVLRLQAFNTSHYAAFHLENILRSRLARKALQLPPGVLQQMGSGSVAKVMLDDVKSLHIFVADSTPLYARAIIMPLATIVILFWLDWRLAIATLGVLAFGSVVLVLARQRSEDMALL